MRRAISIILSAAVLAMTAQAQRPPQTQEVRVRKGMLLKLELLQPLDPATANRGDDVPLRLTRPLYVEGVTLLPEGARLHGVVTKVKRANSHCKRGEVSWKLEDITFADGSTARIRLWDTSPRRDVRVDPQRPKPTYQPGERAGLVLQGVVLTPFVAVALARNGVESLVTKPFKGNSCSRFTKYHPLPAHSTIAMEIMEDHAVHY